MRSIGAVKHEHAVTLYDSGRAEDGRPYIAMEYLEGENRGRAPGPHRGDRRATGRSSCGGRRSARVAAAHRRHIVHGDINPTNLFLTHRESEAGLEEIIKVIDFHIGPRARRPTRIRSGAALASSTMSRPSSCKSGAGDDPLGCLLRWGWCCSRCSTGGCPRRESTGARKRSARRCSCSLASRWPGPGSRGPLSSDLLTLMGDVLRRDPVRRPADAGALLQLIRRLPEVGRLPPSSGGIRIAMSQSGRPAVSPPPSQSTEPDWLAGAKTARGQEQRLGSGQAAARHGARALVGRLSSPATSFETPDMGVAQIAEPPWLTGTQSNRRSRRPRVGMMPATVTTGPTVVTASTPEEAARRSVPRLRDAADGRGGPKCVLLKQDPGS